jgi:hypothetical protein
VKKSFLKRKHDYTDAFIREAGIDPSLHTEVFNRWWYAPKEPNLRLSVHGFDYLTQVLKLTSYKIELGDAQSKLLLLLQKKMDSPYYLHQRRNYAVYSDVSIFASSDATMILLADNNLERYLRDMKG